MSYVKAITDAGTQMFQTSGKTGQAVVVDSMLISSSNLDANNATSLQASDFNGANVFPVVAVGYQNNLYQPQARVTNGQLSSDLTANAVGLLAHLDGSNQKNLIAVMITTGNPTVIPANGNYKRYIGFDIISRAATNLTCNGSNTYADQFASNEASAATVNLSGYVKSTQLSAALAPYATTSALSAYPNTQQLSVSLASYATNASLSNYATNTALSNALAPYATNSELSNYATVQQVNTSLASYATNAELSSYATNAELSSYATTDQLNSSLASYATNSSLNGYVSTSSFNTAVSSLSAAQNSAITAASANVANQMSSYATQSFAAAQYQNAVNTANQYTNNYVTNAMNQNPPFGPKVLPNGTDLNTVTKFGIYILAFGNTYPNYDSNDFWTGRTAWLRVISDSSGNVYQELTCAGVGNIMKRHYSATYSNGFTGWTSWM